MDECNMEACYKNISEIKFQNIFKNTIALK